MMDAETVSKPLEIRSIMTQLTAGLKGRIATNTSNLTGLFYNHLFLARPFNSHFEMTPTSPDKLITNPCIKTRYSALLFLCAAAL
jgi:hypothetical protein